MRSVPTLTAALGLLAACLLASVARPQDGPFGGLQPHYWPHRSFGIPVHVDQITKLANKPTHLQLYYASNRGPFQKGVKLPVDGLRELNSGKKGFLFEAPRDGDYEFTVQFIYADGTVSPKESELGPQIRAIIDTVAPRVIIAAIGNSVEWQASDDNLDPRGITLQCKWPTSSEWTTVPEKSSGVIFRTNDTYAWKMPPGKVLEVRVKSRDQAGHEGISPVVRVPGEAGSTVGLPRAGGGGPSWVGGGAGASLPQPRIDFVNTKDFSVDYTIQHMGRSGVQAAHLFVLKDQGKWDLVKRFDVNLMPDDKPPHSLSLPYSADREGTFGFYIIPESGAGKRADDPKKEDPPMVLVVVDTTKPHVKITGVQVKPGGVHGPLVDITWEVADPNLMPQPVNLEWSIDRKAEKWNEIKYRLDNNLTQTTGRYTWEVPDEKLWKFWIRARAVDKAANVGEDLWEKEVIVDLEKPTATIDRVRGGPAGSGSGKPKQPEKPLEPPPEPDHLP